MKAKDFEKIGLEKILEFYSYTKDEVIFIGRTYNLIKDSEVITIYNSTFHSYNVGTRKEMNLDECKKFLKKHGFPEPMCTYDNKTYHGDPLQFFEYDINGKKYTLCIQKTGEINAL